jgi:hypothetical protein
VLLLIGDSPKTKANLLLLRHNQCQIYFSVEWPIIAHEPIYSSQSKEREETQDTHTNTMNRNWKKVSEKYKIQHKKMEKKQTKAKKTQRCCKII